MAARMRDSKARRSACLPRATIAGWLYSAARRDPAARLHLRPEDRPLRTHAARTRWPIVVAGLAIALFVAVALACGALPEVRATGFTQRTHPLAWLGAEGVPSAAAFNALGFGATGLLMAVALATLRARLPAEAGWSARIGARLLMLSALAFAAQGLYPIDPQHPDDAATGLHGVVWTLWWLAFAAGAPLWALSRHVAWGMTAIIAALGGLLVPLCAVAGAVAMSPALAERCAFALWLAWAAWSVGRAPLSRAGASGPGSSPTARR